MQGKGNHYTFLVRILISVVRMELPQKTENKTIWLNNVYPVYVLQWLKLAHMFILVLLGIVMLQNHARFLPTGGWIKRRWYKHSEFHSPIKDGSWREDLIKCLSGKHENQNTHKKLDIMVCTSDNIIVESVGLKIWVSVSQFQKYTLFHEIKLGLKMTPTLNSRHHMYMHTRVMNL